jgi:hypothetical protein
MSLKKLNFKDCFVQMNTKTLCFNLLIRPVQPTWRGTGLDGRLLPSAGASVALWLSQSTGLPFL